VAVVLAFAVEEWREERELDGLAAEARSAMLREVRRNRDELLELSRRRPLRSQRSKPARAAAWRAARKTRGARCTRRLGAVQRRLNDA
jgi:hypothetical protein